MMIKQKIVFEVYMADDDSRKKAKKFVAVTEGLLSMSVEGDKNQIVIVGVGMDAVFLATTLRKKVGRTIILSIEEVKSEEKKKEEEAAKKKKQDEEDAKNRNVTWSYNHYNQYAPPLPCHGYDVVHYGAPSYPNSWFSW